ncbi:hypothetical protein HW537_14865 [Asaia siamensis]
MRLYAVSFSFILLSTSAYAETASGSALETLLLSHTEVEDNSKTKISPNEESKFFATQRSKLANGQLVGEHIKQQDISQAVSTATGASTVMTAATRAAEALNVKDFGAFCDGSRDDTSSFLKAISVLQAKGGGRLYLPNGGRCVISQTLSVTKQPVVFSGAGKYNTTLTETKPSIDIIQFNGTYFGGGVENLTITSGAAANQGGAGIHAIGVSDVVIRNVNISKTYNGFQEDSAGVVRVENVDASNIIYDSFLLNGGPVQFLNNVTAFNASPNHAGIEVTASGAVHIVNSGMSSQGVALLIDPTDAGKAYAGWTMGEVFDVWASDCDFDDTRGPAIKIAPRGTGLAYSMQFTNIRTGFSSGQGVLIDGSNINPGTGHPLDSGVYNILFNNLQSVNNLKEGLKIVSGTNIFLNNSAILGNSARGGGYSGISVTGGDGISITGTQSTLWKNIPTNQKYGLLIEATFRGHLNAGNNDFRNNLNGQAVFVAAPSGSVTITNSAGYNPRGISVLNVGSSPWEYTAGPSPETLILSGGSVSQVTIGGIAVASSSNISLPLAAHQKAVVTYSALPRATSNAE